MDRGVECLQLAEHTEWQLAFLIDTIFSSDRENLGHLNPVGKAHT